MIPQNNLFYFVMILYQIKIININIDTHSILQQILTSDLCSLKCTQYIQYIPGEVRRYGHYGIMALKCFGLLQWRP